MENKGTGPWTGRGHGDAREAAPEQTHVGGMSARNGDPSEAGEGPEHPGTR